MHIFIKDKVTGEAKMVHLKMNESNYCLSISRDQYSAGVVRDLDYERLLVHRGVPPRQRSP
jgi:hypothetical protein